MKVVTQIMVFGNLLALLAALGIFLAVYPLVSIGPMAAGLIVTLSTAVFIGQRAYVRFLAQRPSEPRTDEGSFAVLPGWLDDWRCPGLLTAGNLLFAALVMLLPYIDGQGYERFRAVIMGYDPNYAHFVFELSGLNPHPVYSFVLGGLVFLALMVGLNVLFNLACILGRWPRTQWLPLIRNISPQHLFICVLGVLILALVLGWNYHYGSKQGQVSARLAVWPQYETVTLDDGQTVRVTPPPGYIRVEPDHPALSSYLTNMLSTSRDRKNSLVAVFAADEQTFQKITKNLESGNCDYNCTVGLAWIEQDSKPSRTYAVDPVMPLYRTTLFWASWVPPIIEGYRASAPDYYLDSSINHFQAFGDEVLGSDLNVDGRVVVGDRLLRTKSNHGQKGRIDEDQRRAYLDHNQKWLRALSGWSPPPPTRPCPGLEMEPGLHPQFLAALEAELLASWKYGGYNSPSTVMSLAYNGEYVLVVGRRGGDIELWDLQKNTKRVLSQAHSERVTALSFTRDGRRFFSATPWGDSIKLWDTQTGEQLLTLPGFTGPVIPVGPGSLYLAARGSEVYLFDSRRQDQSTQALERRNEDEIYRRYAASDPKPNRRNHWYHDRVRALAADEDGRLAAVGTASGYIYLYRLVEYDEGQALEPIGDLKAYEDRDEVVALHFDLESQSLYSVSKSGRIDEWSVPAMNLKRSLPSRASFSTVGSAKFWRDPPLVALVGDADNRIKGLYHESFIELMQLSSGESIVRPIVSVSSAPVEIIEPLNKLIAIQGHAVLTVDIPGSFCPE